jgi:integrase
LSGRFFARREALLLDEVLEGGTSPKVHKAQLAILGSGGTLTFAQAVEGFYEVGLAERWLAKGSRMVMRGVKNNYLLTAACAKLPLQAVNHLHIEAILKQPVHPCLDARGNPTLTRLGRTLDDPVGPLWIVKPQIAKRVQIFLFGMFEYWRSKMKFTGPNPADISLRRGALLGPLLPKQPEGGHHIDLRVDEVPLLVAFMRAPQRDPDLVTTAQLAEALGKNTIAIRAARKRGILTPHKEPGRFWKTASYVYSLKQAAKHFEIVKPVITLRSDEYLYTNILEMIILTLARSDMICKLRWDEIKPKYENSVQGMIIYAKHKTARFGYPYGSVITQHIQDILDAMAERRKRDGIDSEYVFAHGPSETGLDRWKNQPLHNQAIEACLRRCIAQIDAIETKDATVHGMRTSFATWACDINEYSRDLAMVTIGHHIKAPEADKVYLRNMKKLRQRHTMMTEWGEYCLSQCKRPREGNIIQLHSR